MRPLGWVMGMSGRFVSLDPWASQRARPRDWWLLGSGAAALVLSASAYISLAPAADPIPLVRMSDAQMNAIEQQTRQLNDIVARIEQPWPLWLRETLLGAPPGTGVLQIDLDPQQGRFKLVVEAADFAGVEAAIERLERRGHFAEIRTSGHDRDGEGRLRAVIEGRLPTAGAISEAR